MCINNVFLRKNSRLDSFSLFETILALIIITFLFWAVFSNGIQYKNVIHKTPLIQPLLHADALIQQIIFDYQRTHRLQILPPITYQTYQIEFNVKIFNLVTMGDVYEIQATILHQSSALAVLKAYIPK